MKKILFLLLSTVAMYGQVPADATPLENIQITNNTTDNSATKVNVQSTDGTINTISKSDLVNVVEVNDVPSLPLVGEVGKIYVVKNVNKIYRWNGTFYQELADNNNVKLTGDQNIDGYKTFTSTITATTFNDDDFAVNAFSDAGSGVKAASNTAAALLAESVSGPAAIFKTTSGSSIVRFRYGFDEKAYIDINGGYVKRLVPASNILLAGGGDLAQNTAFNKNFGTTAGTVVEGNYPPAKDGTGSTGTWGINISGNAATASNSTLWNNQPSLWSSFATGINWLTGGEGGVVKPVEAPAVRTFLGLENVDNTSDLNKPISTATQTALDGKQNALGYTPENIVNKGVANGYASLDGSGRVPLSQLPTGTQIYVGTWNALTNTPTLSDGVGSLGKYYIVNKPGTQNLGSGSITYALRDNIVYNGSIWEKVANSGGVTSVNGMTGAVSLLTTNISEGSNLYYTESRVNANSNVSSNTASRHSPITVDSSGLNNGLSLSGQTLSLGLSSSSQNGSLSSANWNAFNNKENSFSKNTAFNKNFGATSGTVVEGNDSRLSDSRTPTAGSSNYIQNQNASAQSANMWISGSATIGANIFAENIIGLNYSSGSSVGKINLFGGAINKGGEIILSGGSAAGDIVFKTGNGAGSQPTALTLNADKSATFSSSVTASSFNGSATLTGTPTAPTAAAGTNTTQIATTAFVAGGLATKENTFSKNTAFNKNFGTTAGTVVEGGTLGSNAYTSTVIPTNTNQLTNGSGYITDISGKFDKTGGTISGNVNVTGTVTASPATASNHLVTKAQLDASVTSRPYKVYTALVSQTGTNAPTATALENTLGGTVVWSRIGNGVYLGELTGAFVNNKTWSSVSIGGYLSGGVNSVALKRFDNNSVILITNKNTLSSDNILDLASIEIRVYPSLE